jgi:hypothetical protein
MLFKFTPLARGRVGAQLLVQNVEATGEVSAKSRSHRELARPSKSRHRDQRICPKAGSFPQRQGLSFRPEFGNCGLCPAFFWASQLFHS